MGALTPSSSPAPRRIATERRCASSPSARASVMAAGARLRKRALHRACRIEVRFMKSSTPSPEEKRALRAVGSTWLEPAT